MWKEKEKEFNISTVSKRRAGSNSGLTTKFGVIKTSTVLDAAFALTHTHNVANV